MSNVIVEKGEVIVVSKGQVVSRRPISSARAQEQIASARGNVVSKPVSSLVTFGKSSITPQMRTRQATFLGADQSFQKTVREQRPLSPLALADIAISKKTQTDVALLAGSAPPSLQSPPPTEENIKAFIQGTNISDVTKFGLKTADIFGLGSFVDKFTTQFADETFIRPSKEDPTVPEKTIFEQFFGTSGSADSKSAPVVIPDPLGDFIGSIFNEQTGQIVLLGAGTLIALMFLPTIVRGFRG